MYKYSIHALSLALTIIASCTSDSLVKPEAEAAPMRFSQNAIASPGTKASSLLTEGFLVSCWKGFGTGRQFTVMDQYEVKYKTDAWANLSRWDYVGTTDDGFYQSQSQRYWDSSAYPYRFYAISPCPAPADITSFSLTDAILSIPSTVTFTSQTCTNGTLTETYEPYTVAQVECQDATNANDTDLLNNGSPVSKDNSTTTYDRFVALPFHHLTSKVRFAIYSIYRKEHPQSFYLDNVTVKVISDNFITEARGYTADLNNADMLHGRFTETAGTGNILLRTDDTRSGDLNVAVDREHAYYCECTDGMLQIPQQGVKMQISFDIHGIEYRNDFTTEDGHITYDMASRTIHYTDIAINDGDSSIWEAGKIYTYIIKVTEFYPLTIDFTTELVPWTDVSGSIETNLEK